MTLRHGPRTLPLDGWDAFSPTGRGRAVHAIEVLREMLECRVDTGRVFFLRRPPEHFLVGPSPRMSPVGRANIWNGIFSGKEALNRPCSDGYLTGEVDGLRYRAHRVVFALHHGRWPSGEVDHIDGDPKNNRINNLREATRAQNMRNTKGRAGTSKYCGVHWSSRDQVWRAECRNLDGRKVRLGTFRDEISAARAYDAAAREFHGEFARLNFSY